MVSFFRSFWTRAEANKPYKSFVGRTYIPSKDTPSFNQPLAPTDRQTISTNIVHSPGYLGSWIFTHLFHGSNGISSSDDGDAAFLGCRCEGVRHGKRSLISGATKMVGVVHSGVEYPWCSGVWDTHLLVLLQLSLLTSRLLLRIHFGMTFEVARRLSSRDRPYYVVVWLRKACQLSSLQQMWIAKRLPGGRSP